MGLLCYFCRRIPGEAEQHVEVLLAEVWGGGGGGSRFT